jgi:hypothetical protein
VENTYPSSLIERLQKYFKQKYSKEISSTQAIEYLDSLAELHTSFIGLLKNENKEKALSDLSGS